MAKFFADKPLKRLVNGKLQDVDAEESLGGKTVLVYCSAHWCPPCRAFTPTLKSVYEELKAAGEAVEVVFLSCDKDEAAMIEYMKEAHGNWLVVPVPGGRELVVDHFQVGSIPELMVVTEEGEIDTKGLVIAVQANGAAFFKQFSKKE